jgi:transporter family-2 protein
VSGNAGAVAFALVAGVAGSIQVVVNATLGRRIGVVDAAAFGAVVAMLVLVTATVFVRSGDGVAAAFKEPPWLWLGGVMGALIVTAIAYSPPRIGTFATIGIIVAGQLVMGALIDAFGLFGVERIPLDPARVTGLVLLAAGALLVLKR